MPPNLLSPHVCPAGLKTCKKIISSGRTAVSAHPASKSLHFWRERPTSARSMATTTENGPTITENGLNLTQNGPTVVENGHAYTKNGPRKTDICPSLEDLELAQVQVVFRHGARTPNSWSKEKFNDFTILKPHVWDETMVADLPGPTLPYSITLPGGECPKRPMFDECVGMEVVGGCRTGQLTTLGRQQLRDLGEHLAAEYITKKHLISASYDPLEVYLRTTYFQRTSQSLINLLKGLYAGGTIPSPLQIETKEDKVEDLHPNLSYCAPFIKWTNQHYANTKPEVTAFEHRINELMGLRDGCERVWASRLGDLIRCRRTHGFSVPQYLLDNEDTINAIELDTCQGWFGKGNTQVARLCIGSFVNTICERTSAGVSGSSSHKMFLYSGHDWTILPLLIVLGVDVKEWPPFASNIIFELYKQITDQRQWFIRVVYNGEVLVLDKDSGLEFISVERFWDMLEEYRVCDISKEWGNEG